MQDPSQPSRRLLFLTCSLLAASGTAVLFLTVHPNQVRNIPLPNAYGPVLALIWMSITLCAQGILLQWRRAVLLGTVVTLLAFLQLQGVLTPSITLWILIGALSIELSYLIFWIMLVTFALRAKKRRPPHRQHPTDLV